VCVRVCGRRDLGDGGRQDESAPDGGWIDVQFDWQSNRCKCMTLRPRAQRICRGGGEGDQVARVATNKRAIFFLRFVFVHEENVKDGGKKALSCRKTHV